MRFNFAALACTLPVALLLSGCSTSFNPATTTSAKSTFGGIHGIAHGGRQAITGARIFLLAAGANKPAGPGIAAYEGNASVSLIQPGGPGVACDSDPSSPTNGDCYVTTGGGGAFNLGGLYQCTPGQEVYLYGIGGDPGGGDNAAAGMLAILGQCPNDGSQSLAGVTPTVYLTELSTVVAAYSFAGYASDALHVSSSGTALAQTGIANAFANSMMLYDIANTNNKLQAYATNPFNQQGSTVPQELIDSLANSLAACVNSNSFAPDLPDPDACNMLFENAKDYRGFAPGDTASAAINIAHNPSANVAAILNLPGPIASHPFMPYLPAAPIPNDLTVAITYNGVWYGDPTSGFLHTFDGPDQIAVDAAGNAWIAEYSNSDLAVLAPNGSNATTVTYALNGGGGINFPLGIAIDQNGRTWIANRPKVVSETLTDDWILYSTSGLNFPFSTAVDANNNIWFTNTGGAALAQLDSSGTPVYPTGQPPQPDSNLRSQYIAINSANTVWLSEETSDASAYYYTTITPSGPAGSTSYTYTEAPFTGGTLGAVAIDSSDNVWFSSVNGPSVTGGALTEVNSSGSIIATCSGTGLGVSGSIAVDGSGNVWAAVHDPSANGGNGLYTIAACNSKAKVVTPAAGYTGGTLTYPQGIAIDGSGDVWYTNYYNTVDPLPSTPDGTTVVEIIGAATPVITPISPVNPGNPSATGLGVTP